MKYFWHISLFIISLLGATLNTNAQEFNPQDSLIIDTAHVENIKRADKPITRILFIFDSSQSMLGRWDGRRKIDVARNLMSELLDSLATVEGLEIGLRVYGHQKPVPPQDCSDTKLEVPFEPDNVDKIKYVLEGLVARGTTPIARSLEEGAYDFPDDDFSRNIVILITDGVEACNGDPCAVSLALQSRGVILKPFIIGLGLDVEFKDVFECVGFYFDATTSREFRHALRAVMDQVLNYTSAQVNLLDTDGNPTETNAVMTFHDHLSGDIRYNYMHTINEQGNPDTVLLDIMTKYDLVVHTIPPVRKDSIVLDPGVHNIITLPAPQGYLRVEIPGENPRDSLVECIVRKQGAPTTLNVQHIHQTGKYITGNYDIEVLTIPRKIFTDVNVKQSFVSKIQIPQPGEIVIHFEKPVIGDILHEDGDYLESVYKLSPYKNDYSIRLLPGRYRLVYRYAKDKKTKYTVEKRFNVYSGQHFEIKTK
ncbi:MAG: VWA domain-containing protein [Bacteroidota bacterium]|nr:VWA domain-containing protein [Bacteroidota bacterium]